MSSPSSSLATSVRSRARNVAFTRERATRALHHLGIFGGFASREIPVAVINVSTLAYAPVYQRPDKGLESTAAAGSSRKHCCVVAQVWRPSHFVSEMLAPNHGERFFLPASFRPKSSSILRKIPDDFTRKFRTLVTFGDNYGTYGKAAAGIKKKKLRRTSIQRDERNPFISTLTFFFVSFVRRA